MFSHHILQVFEPLGRQEDNDHLYQHSDGLVLQCGGLESTLVDLGEEGSEELESASLNEERDELVVV